jgi:hypothetical protein
MNMHVEHPWNNIWKGKTEILEGNCPSATLPQQIQPSNGILQNSISFKSVSTALKAVTAYKTWNTHFLNVNKWTILITVHTYRPFATTVSQLKISDFSVETFKGFEVLYFSMSATTTQLLSSGSFYKLRYDTILLKVHLQTLLSIPITQKCQILSSDTLVANERYVCALKNMNQRILYIHYSHFLVNSN